MMICISTRPDPKSSRWIFERPSAERFERSVAIERLERLEQLSVDSGE